MVARRSRLLLLTVGAAAVGILAVSIAHGLSQRGATTAGSTAAGATLAVGAIAPTGTLSSTHGDVVNLADFRGKRNMMLYFYEHAG